MKRIYLTESQLYRLIEQAINEEIDDLANSPTHLQIIADAFIGQTVICGGDINRDGKTRQVGDAQWMDKKEANSKYSLYSDARPLYYNSSYMGPRAGYGNLPFLVLFDTKGKCIAWIDHYKAIEIYRTIRKQNISGDSIIRLY